MKKEYYKKWAEENQDKLKENRKRWALKNSEKIKESSKKYKEKNRELLRLKAKEYYENNKSECLERNKKILRNKYNTDDLFRLKFNLRKLINKTIVRKGYTKKSKSMTILGCDFEFFKKHIEGQFEEWMTWDNYGGTPKYKEERWEIDHIKPISLAKDENEILMLNHFSNLRPLCSFTNRWIKSDNYESKE